MAERTRHDRLALVPRTLEARGLDASPAVKAKSLSAGNARGGEILDLILRDETGQVAVGNRWYRRHRWLQPACRGALRSTRPQAPGTTVRLHHPPGAARRTGAVQRRQAGGVEAQDAMARRHHALGDVAPGVHQRPRWCHGRDCVHNGLLRGS
jgi:hypothetical protein